MPHDERTTVVLEWLRKAENDLTAISLLLPSPHCPFDVVCFHAQQAAEKYLKGLLVHLDVPFPKTHNIAAILHLLPLDLNLSLAPEQINALSRWAVIARYPDFEEDLQRSDAEAAVETARQIKECVLRALQREGFDMRLLNRPKETEEET